MNGRLTWFLFGAFGVLLLAIVAGWIFLAAGLMPVNADAQPSAFERFLARLSLHASRDRDATPVADPLPLDAANLSAGLKLYAANCIVCHGAADGRPSDVAMGLYQHAPQFGFHGVEDDPEYVTHWVVSHGIRFTGMPSFDVTLTDTQIWQLTMFLKHMDSLPAAQAKLWKRLPSQGGARPHFFGPPPQARG